MPTTQDDDYIYFINQNYETHIQIKWLIQHTVNGTLSQVRR